MLHRDVSNPVWENRSGFPAQLCLQRHARYRRRQRLHSASIRFSATSVNASNPMASRGTHYPPAVSGLDKNAGPNQITECALGVAEVWRHLAAAYYPTRLDPHLALPGTLL